MAELAYAHALGACARKGLRVQLPLSAPSMNIYVAAKFKNKAEVLKLYDQLRAAGHTVTYDWTTHQPIKPYGQHQELARTYSENEIQGIANSDVLIFLSAETGTTMWMEIGAAIVLQKKFGRPKVYAVGQWNSKSPWLFNSAVIRKNSVEEVLAELR